MSLEICSARPDAGAEIRVPIYHAESLSGELVIDLAAGTLYASVVGRVSVRRDRIRVSLSRLEEDGRRVELFPGLWLTRKRTRVIVAPNNIAIGSVCLKSLALGLQVISEKS